MAAEHRYEDAGSSAVAVDGTNIPDTILIPAGPFWMGSLPDDPKACENEKPRWKELLPEYRIGRHPITNAQYARFVSETGQIPPTHWDGTKIPSGLEDHPVVETHHQDAEAYCRWLSQITGQHYCLPTEEQWEKAARGSFPEARCYPWGNKWQSSICNTKESGQSGTTSVHDFEQTNQSPFGVVDMAGNVWEWTASWYERYPDSCHESLRYGRLYRVVRGGSWQNSHREARISCRGRYRPEVRRSYLGFRIASDMDIGAGSSEEGSAEEAKTRAHLRQNLKIYFDESELKDLCFDLHVDYDGLRGENKADKARELIAHLERRNRVAELIEACKRLRPDVRW